MVGYPVRFSRVIFRLKNVVFRIVNKRNNSLSLLQAFHRIILKFSQFIHLQYEIGVTLRAKPCQIPMTPMIQAKNLSKHFGDIRAVDDLSFTVPSGQVYGFLGQNGAGKSTTIRMLLTLVRPDAGSIEIFGLDLRRHRNEILRQTGAIIEKPDLYKYLTAKENLRIFARMSGVVITEKKLIEQLAIVGLADRVDSKVKTYSQGMKQRLGIAVALVHDPRLVVLDEPVNGLDPQGIADIRHLILHLSRDLGKTVVVSSHLLNEIELIAGSMLIIDKGKKIAEGTKEELLNPGSVRVELITDDNEGAGLFLQESEWKMNWLKNEDGAIVLEMSKNKIPDLNKSLVEKGIRVYSLRPKHSLEDFFLALTKH
jgi:ABC-type multidrug transport system ATPase subunit